MSKTIIIIVYNLYTFQTGSGKTFTITGGAERYIDRGIIPRTLSYIFEYFRLAVERRSPSLVVLRGTLIEESFHEHCPIYLNISDWQWKDVHHHWWC